MQIIITGGAGFIGQRLATALLSSDLPFDQLVLADQVMPNKPAEDSRIQCLEIDLAERDAARSIVSNKSSLLFHLAAVVSSQAEKEFDLGWQVNLDITRHLLEASRHQATGLRFIFSSSLAVFGGALPGVVGDQTAVTPRSSYGSQKAMGELLVNDYSRKGFVDGRVLRLPTICVRPGRPNLAASSFVSSIIREPLNGETAICPIPASTALWLSSPDTVIHNILHAGKLSGDVIGDWRTINLPGVSVTVQEMLDSLDRQAGKEALARVQFKPDPAISRIVSSWPGKIDNSRGLKLGFKVDGEFDDFIKQFKRRQKSA